METISRLAGYRWYVDVGELTRCKIPHPFLNCYNLTNTFVNTRGNSPSFGTNINSIRPISNSIRPISTPSDQYQTPSDQYQLHPTNINSIRPISTPSTNINSIRPISTLSDQYQLYPTNIKLHPTNIKLHPTNIKLHPTNINSIDQYQLHRPISTPSTNLNSIRPISTPSDQYLLSYGFDIEKIFLKNQSVTIFVFIVTFEPIFDSQRKYSIVWYQYQFYRIIISKDMTVCIENLKKTKAFTFCVSKKKFFPQKTPTTPPEKQ